MMNSVEKSIGQVKRIQYRSSGKSYRNDMLGKKKYLFFKRCVDLFVSSLVILGILSWLYPVLALMIKMSSRGPVFFRQKRVGYMGRTFYCFKFRTMKPNAQADLLAAQENDQRITRLGNFLRKSNLDELPQFLNVFLGQMSIVGPRPHMHADCYKFSQHVYQYKFRNLAKPGITGLAQVKGFRGQADSFEQIFLRYQFDAFYVRNANSGLDLRIMRQTATQTFFLLLQQLGLITPKEIPQGKQPREKKIFRNMTIVPNQLVG